MTGLPGVSIVIPNYNYARFVGAAIESALAQDHPSCEVIVVDDHSSDGSRAVIERYAGRVRAVFLPENGGQVPALNAGWPLARHPILIFLDSDDLLEPHAASTAARAFAPGVAKVQFPMTTIDAQGRPLGHVAPKYPSHLDTETIRNFILKVGASPSSPGSGNAYAKSLLERISPIDVAEKTVAEVGWMDPILESNAPFYGEVLTLREPLVRYRMHGANNYMGEVVSADRFVKYAAYFEAKLRYIHKRCETWDLPFDLDAARRRSLWYLECQMAAAKLMSRGDPRRLSPLQIVAWAIRAAPQSPYDAKRRAVLLAWLAAVAVAPRRLAKELITYRMVVARRPRWLERVVRLLAS